MKRFILLTVIALTLSITTKAQQEKGDIAIQFSGNFYTQSIDFGTTKEKFYSGNIYVKLGKFFTPNIELGVKPNVSISPRFESKIVKGEIQTTKKLGADVGFGLYGTYSFLTADAKMMPYAGAEVSYAPTGDESTINLGPYAGVKYFLTEKINIDANASYLINLGSTYGNQSDTDIGGLLTINLGIGVILGKLK